VFYALWPDDAARTPLAAIAAEAARNGGGRAIATANLHVTLAFVGSVAAARVDALRDAGALASRDVGAIDLALDRIGGAHGGELLWIAASAVPEGLVRLRARLGAALEARGFPVERREFRPHVTLARGCVRRVPALVEPVAWRVSRITLMASDTRPEGAQYRELAAWPLEDC
jgi:2'-5' RNA ligase